MKPFTWNYKLLQPMDIFFNTKIFSFLGVVIRTDNAGIKHAFDEKIPNHTGFITSDRGQFFATEESWPRGLQVNSLEKYCGKNNQVIAVYRWKGFYEASGTLEQALDLLAWYRRKMLDYDLFTLFTYPKVLRWLRPVFGRKNDDDEKQICSETVFRILAKFGMAYPPLWDKLPPSPYELMNYFNKHTDQFVTIGYKQHGNAT